ncbi:TRAP transporter substrate-binding protein [Litoribacterium kuwaitense]|uniref:TRAP transporter substrate-binding protein n=1 Tax=Litoribacterium kuwaitense TaxID=1398745 RepID=UPI001FEBFF72|nr:TRAP transporter substrate-binding protein [Litoribacterium kuwaitense]
MIAVSLVVAFLLNLTGCQLLENAGKANAEGITTIKIAHYFSETHPNHIALREKFKPMIEEKTNGKYKVEIYPANELGDEAQFISGARIGTIQIAVAGMWLQSANPKIGAVEWPFLFDSYEQAKYILNGKAGDELSKAYKELGLETIGWAAHGFRVVSANRPIESMKDFQGFRLRVTNLPMFVSLAEALGTNVQPLALSEVFTALEQGVIDGQENPYVMLKESAMYEVQSHVIETNHVFSPIAYLMNKKFFEGLDAETKEIVMEAAQKSADYEWELLQQAEEEVKDYLTEEGLEVIVPDEQLKQDLRDAMNPVYENLYQEYDWAQEFVQ